MGTLSIQLTETGQVTLTKTFTVADSDIDKVTAAYQSDANVSVNGSASRAQVWLYIAGLWAAQLKQKVQAANTVPAIVPAPISMT